jgi:hypothetical protein
MSVRGEQLVKRNAQGEILYAVAYETATKADIAYLHAPSIEAARVCVIKNKALGAARIVTIAPAIGSFTQHEEHKKIIVVMP